MQISHSPPFDITKSVRVHCRSKTEKIEGIGTQCDGSSVGPGTGLPPYTLKALPSFDLDRFLQQISDKLGLAGTININRPFDTTHLNAIPRDELELTTIEYGLRVVRRMNGEIFQFTRRPSFTFPTKHSNIRNLKRLNLNLRRSGQMHFP